MYSTITYDWLGLRFRSEQIWTRGDQASPNKNVIKFVCVGVGVWGPAVAGGGGLEGG